MLNVTATNFGVSPEDIRVRYFGSDSLVVLDGEFIVDAADEDYAAARYLTLTVEDLPFAKSRETTGFAYIEVDGVRHITLAKCRITGRNTVRIGKISEYDSVGSYTVRLCSAFVPTCVVGDVVLSEERSFAPVASCGTLLNAKCFGAESADWMMLCFIAEDLTFDGDAGTVVADLEGFPADLSFALPLIYNETLYDELGSRYIPASVSGGVLTMRKEDAPEAVVKVGKFFSRIFIVK